MVVVNKQICPKCGLIVDNDAKFCEGCGIKLNKDDTNLTVKKQTKTDKKPLKDKDSRRKIGIVLILIIIFISTYFIVGGISRSVSSSGDTSTDSFVSQNQPIDGVYTGNGISFKVPSGYYVVSNTGSTDLVSIQKNVNSADPSNNYEGMSILKLGTGNSLNTVVQKFGPPGEILSKKSLIIDGVSAYEIQSQDSRGDIYFDIFIVKNGMGYVLSFFGKNLAEGINPSNNPDIQLITDSFKID